MLNDGHDCGVAIHIMCIFFFFGFLSQKRENFQEIDSCDRQAYISFLITHDRINKIT